MLRLRKELERECWEGVSPVGGTWARLCCFRLTPPPYLGKMPGCVSICPPPRGTPRRGRCCGHSPPVWSILPLAAGMDLGLS